MKISNNLRTILVQAAAARFDQAGGAAYCEIRTGAAPTNVSDADSGTLLATLTFDFAAFIFPITPTATAGPISDDVAADATGTAAHFRIKDSSGVVICQGTVGTSGADMNFDSVSFTVGDRVSISSLTLTMPANP